MNANPKFHDIAHAPEIRALSDREFDRIAAEGKAHRDAIATLDVGAGRAYDGQEKRKAAALASRDAARVAFLTAEQQMLKTFAEVAGERLDYEAARRSHEAALLAPEFPEIAEFSRWARDEIDRTNKMIATATTLEKNARTGRERAIVSSNAASIAARTAALRQAIEAAAELRLIADPRQIPERLAALRAVLPAVAMAAADSEA